MAHRVARLFAVVAVGLAWTTAASAGEIIEYKYDAQGRLVRVFHTASSTQNQNVQACYKYDDAGNRIRVKTSPTSPSAPPACPT